MRRISVTEMRAFRRCRRAHHYAYNLRRRPHESSDALAFGKAIHKALEMWWICAWWGVLKGRLRFALAELAGVADAHLRAKAEAMIIGYHERWKGEPLEVVAIEAPWTTPLVNPATGRESPNVQLFGVIDVLVRRDGDLYVMEHKTSSEDFTPGSVYLRRLRLDSQISTYMAGAGALGQGEPLGVIYDVLGKPRLKVLQANKQRAVEETPDEYRARILESIAADPLRYYARPEVVRLEHDVREAAADDWATARAIHEAARTGVHPRNPDACERYGSMCEYFDVCTGAASIDDDVLFGTSKRRS